MIVTDNVTKLTFTDFLPSQPATWDLSSFIPAGALDITHIECRIRPVNKYWLPWMPVDAWDNVTKVATLVRPVVFHTIEFRRVTPKYEPWENPLNPTSRVVERTLQNNADQGLMVATETAAEFGIDARVQYIEPGSGPNDLGLLQLTQNHWGPEADYTQHEWNFQFAGGYLSREHVKAQALTPSGWVQLAIDTEEYDPLDPTGAAFRFLDDYQLHLDLTTLEQPVTGLIIYRFTPRTVNVESPDDNVRIRAPGMEPSARHAFYVAVEIGEEISKRAPVCECPNQWFTSTIYPLFFRESMTVLPSSLRAGSHIGIVSDVMSVGSPMLRAGSLGPASVYTHWRDVIPETMTVPTPALRTGMLAQTLITYANWRDYIPETMEVGTPALREGTLLQTVVEYLNWRDTIPETMTVVAPTLRNGTLA